MHHLRYHTPYNTSIQAWASQFLFMRRKHSDVAILWRAQNSNWSGRFWENTVRHTQANRHTYPNKPQNTSQGWGLVRKARCAKKVTKPSCAHNFHTLLWLWLWLGVLQLLSFLFYKMNHSQNMHDHDFYSHIQLSMYMKNALYLKKCRENPDICAP